MTNATDFTALAVTSVTFDTPREVVFRGKRRLASHLSARTPEPADIEELHKAAASIGLLRSWFQPESWPHYDLFDSKIDAARRAGIPEIGARDHARHRINYKRRQHNDNP